MGRLKAVPNVPSSFPMERLAELGQSVWLDFIDRGLIRSGELQKLTRRGLRGLTSNPTLFNKAISQTASYDTQIHSLLAEQDLEAKDLFDKLSIGDIRDAADLFRDTYERTGGLDGMVSLEVAPYLAHDAEETISEAMRLWSEVARPNVMIKVPGTSEGLVAFEKLIEEGVNVNVTLLFSRDIYRRFAEAYFRALELRKSKTLPIDGILSVASFFVSRIDSEVDRRIEDALHKSLDRKRRETLESLRGKVAIANAACAYETYRDLLQTPRWHSLEALGAKPQRLLWASTSTKNPEYRDVMYVEGLIAPGTVNTLPKATLLDLEDHAKLDQTLRASVQSSHEVLARIASVGISLQEVAELLLAEGIQLFAEAYQRLMMALECKRRTLLKTRLNSLDLRLPILLETEIGRTLQNCEKTQLMRRLWKKDSSLWTGSGEEHWLGWLNVIDSMLSQVTDLESFAKTIASLGFRDAVVLGMGGSSLCADVLASVYEPGDRFPDLHVLDSTHPEQIRTLEEKLEPSRTLFIVSSKSGTTLEPMLLLDYFYSQMTQAVGEAEVGSHFVAITDPGTELEKIARDRKFRRIFHGVKTIGGRYSALSHFGMLPAAVMGMNVRALLRGAQEMAHACSPNIDAQDNPGLVLGAVLGTLAAKGRDKVTLICSPEIWDMAAWLEQLLAESTGKNGKGLIPITEERLGAPSQYDNDRQFVYLKLNGTLDRDLDKKIAALAAHDFPVVQIDLCNQDCLTQEFFRWELATAVAASVLGVNAFDQPDVESAKRETTRLTSRYEKTGQLEQPQALIENERIALYADSRNAQELANALKGKDATVARYFKAHLDRLCSGDYLAILAFLPMSFAVEGIFNELRLMIRDRLKQASCIGFGPRYLHSTGQIHKGGPDSGVFLQVTAPSWSDIPIPGHRGSFALVNEAQARGDFNALAERGRRLLRLHIKAHDTAELDSIFSSLVREVFP